MQILSRLDLSDAQILLEGARAKAEELGIDMCIAVVDEAGHLIAFERMDGARLTSINIAIDKAFTAAAARKATHEYGLIAQPGGPVFGINTALQGRLMVVGGGLPVMAAGSVVGGIGVSSGTPAEDQAVAQAGITHWAAHVS